MKRLMATVLAILMVVAITGCGSKKRQPIQLTLSTEDAEAILAAAGITLPDADEAAGAYTTVQWFCWGDPFQNYSEDEIVNTGYWTFQEKYGGDIDYIETDYFERNDDLAMLLTAGTPPDLCSGGSGSTAMYPMNCIKQMIQPVDPWIDFDDPLWSNVKNIADYFVLGENHYQIVLNTKPANVCLYNRRVFDEWGFDDPAELYYNDEWTWDVFYNMCLDFSDVDEDRFALDGYPYSGALVQSTGQQFLQVDEFGHFYSNLDSPEIERAQDMLYDLCKNDCNYRGSSGNRWDRRDMDGGPCGMKDGKLLFYILGESFFTAPVEEIEGNFGAISEGELMFAPLPRDPQGDGVYYLETSFDDIKGSLCIVNNAKNPDGAALLATCMRFKIIDPVVIQIDKRQLKEVYKWSDEMLDMSEVCKELCDTNRVFSLGGNLPDNLQNVLNSLDWGIARSANPTSWGQMKDQYRDQLDYYVEELNALIEENQS